MNPLVELLLGFGGVALMIFAAAGLVWGLVEVGLWLLSLAI